MNYWKKRRVFSEYTVTLLCFRESHITIYAIKDFPYLSVLPSSKQTTPEMKGDHVDQTSRSIGFIHIHHIDNTINPCVISYPRLIISLIPFLVIHHIENILF
jgi:hypothetical protein